MRRTSSIDVDWPDGRKGDMRFLGRARDAVTLPDEAFPMVCAEDAFEARIRPDRTILEIAADPPRTGLERLVGCRGGGHLRQALEDLIPEERRRATPLHLILDDISGVSLIAGWVWSQWGVDWIEETKQAVVDAARDHAHRMEGVCIGFRPGSSALNPDNFITPMSRTPGTDLRNPEDPEGWHAFPPHTGPAMRRARRIDVRIGDVIEIEAAFQDSGTTPEGERALLHEYRLWATADRETLRILSASAEPRVVPFPECVLAPGNLGRLVGSPLGELRETVLSELRATAGCTHLNDALRSLAETPALVARLQEAVA